MSRDIEYVLLEGRPKLITQHPLIDITKYLTNDLRKPEYRNRGEPLAGYCYIVAEAFFHLFPGEWKPLQARVEGQSHWVLKSTTVDTILDVTVSQFHLIPDYSTFRGKGFLTQRPSRRAQTLISLVREGYPYVFMSTSQPLAS